MPPAMSWNSLPLELGDRIIDHLHDDPANLKHCALTCRTFLRCSRFNRFRTVIIKERNAVKFLQLLRTSPVGRFVHTLITITRSTNMPSFGPYSNVLWVEKHLPELSKALPFVRTLEMQRYDTPRASTFTGFTSVESLVFKNSLISNINQYRDLLCSFPSLRSARFQGCMIGKSDQVTSPEPKIPSLRTLDFILSQLDPLSFVEWLLTQPPSDTLERMTLSPLQKPTIAPAGSLLKAVGTSLGELRISIIFPHAQDSIPDVPYDQLSLEDLTNLEFLSFGSPAAHAKLNPIHIDMSFSWYAFMLESVTSRCLQTISFSLMTGDIDEVTKLSDWERIIQLLSSSQFTKVKEFRFYILADGIEEFVSDLRRSLSALDEAGKLAFYYTYDDTLKAEFPTVQCSSARDEGVVEHSRSQRRTRD
ncbi:hypothetical protein QCA50_006410 [Cerrena zonata]|uniref:F-box domain-containing protein n=1 Tax=Cerrena zonata TaxID=2478898 RepID=A0AAW0GAA2_9APHY